MPLHFDAWTLIAVAGLGVMVFVHELGHFVAAKLNGVEVEVFSLGWGPRLAGFRYKGTMYQISWLPIGGFCKMKGEMIPGLAGGTDAGGAAPVHEKGSFLAAASWRRMVIYVFGPMFNLLFAFLVFAFIWWIGFQTNSWDNRVVLATDYSLNSFPEKPPATAVGLKTGDRIIAIDGVSVENFQDILEAVSVAPGKTLQLTVQRGAPGATGTEIVKITPQLDKNDGSGKIGIYRWIDPVVLSVEKGSAAAIAGIRPGDRLMDVGGHHIGNYFDIEQSLVTRPAKVPIMLERAGKQVTATLVLAYSDSGTNLGIKFVYNIYHSPAVGPIGAIKRGADETWRTITLTVKGIGLLFKGINIRNAVAGPLGIISAIGTVASSGFEVGVGFGLVNLFNFLSLLSVVLFLMNLLPIPAMDGGQIVLLLVEIVRGKPVKASLAWRLQVIGFTLMVSLFILVTLNDVLRGTGR